MSASPRCARPPPARRADGGTPVTTAPAPQTALRTILGAEGLLTADADCAPFLVDQLQRYHGRTLGVALPRSTAEVAQVLALCNSARIGVVPQGGNTGYCGGATPDESGTQLVLSLRGLNRVRSVDAAGYSLVAEAGCLLVQVQDAAAAAQRLFPLSLGSEGSCQIGGNLSTNAGGTAVLRYGMMRDLVLGLEVVLADGRVLDTLTSLRKDNTGYDIKSLFLGAEGTLGVITAASLKLFPQQQVHATALAAVADVAAAVRLLAQLRESSGDRVSSFELIPRIAVDLAARHIEGVSDPLPGGHEWYVLCELSAARAAEPLDTVLQEALAAAHESGLVRDAVLCHSERERLALWKLRESIPQAQRREGASLRHDISVPVGALPQFMARAVPWVGAHVPQGRLVAYGHVGDGNLHFNLNQAAGTAPAELLAQAPRVRRGIHDMVQEFGGSFSAEHGIGQSKVAELERYAPPLELELMRAIKHAFDPNGILNPGKVLR
ncbi:MAG: FAD-binding oxidoreductase [Proteobacteria bacterium]|nr:FAD-binding oxidoreductase [Pseudomonadota bacterium]